jgi:23S rRNA pseudouridine1911/1915/1917 synthase
MYQVIFEDQDLLVINKPPGVVVNRAETVGEPTIQDWMMAYLAQSSEASSSATQAVSQENWQALIPADFQAEYGTPEVIFSERQGIVHRLDKETSGALLLAKNPGSLVALLKQFKDHQVKKTYQCLVHGKFSVSQDVISLPMGRASHDRKQFAVRSDGREAITEYRVEKFYPQLDSDKLKALPQAKGQNIAKKIKMYQGFSLVTCLPKTGRTHQIRVHLAHLRHPLVGDKVYAGKKRQALDHLWCQRHFLHASELTFTHPRTHERVTVNAPLPQDLQAALDFLVDL